MKRYEPHPYQEDAIRFVLEHPGAGLFLNPGYGKTSIILASLLVLKSKGYPHRALIVAPPRVVREVWGAERNKWIDFHGLSLVALHGEKKAKLLAPAIIDKPDILLVSYDGLEWAINNQVVHKTGRRVLVCDESSFIKNPSAKRFKLLRSIRDQFDRQIMLTGTPIPNGYEDLWSQVFMLDGGDALGRFVTHYRNRYFQNVGYGFNDYRLLMGAADLINERIKPLVFRGDAPEVQAAMPALTYNRVSVSLPDTTLKLYRELERDLYLDLGHTTVITPTAAALSMKLRQVCNGMVLDDNKQPLDFHAAKLDALRSIVEELNGQPLLVFYEFVADRDRICKEFDAPYIGGGVSATDAAAILKRFNNGELPLLAIHPQSGGFGLNLQEACSNVCWFGPTWNAGFWDQGNARVNRQGQQRPVVIHTIIADGTLDMLVAETLEKKLSLQEALLDAVKRDEEMRS